MHVQRRPDGGRVPVFFDVAPKDTRRRPFNQRSELMLRSMMTRLARRKIETVITVVVSAVAAVGLLTQIHAPDVGAPAPVATFVSAAAASHIPILATAAKTAPSVATSASATSFTHIDNPRVDSWIARFTTDLRSTFAGNLDRMAKYSDMIVGELDDRGMPRELIYLAMIESDFNPHAKSRVKAS